MQRLLRSIFFIWMSLNRYEQTIFNYWQDQPDELRHWKTKIAAIALSRAEPGEAARNLERDLWDYFVERRQFVAVLRSLDGDGLRRVSLLNLAEHVLRLWGPPIKTRKPPPV